MSIDDEKDTKKKIPRVPETLLKKRKKFETLKAAREEAARKEEKVIVFLPFLRQTFGVKLELLSYSILSLFSNFVFWKRNAIQALWF